MERTPRGLRADGALAQLDGRRPALLPGHLRLHGADDARSARRGRVTAAAAEHADASGRADGGWAELARWPLPAGAGRRYARVSGDYNPIHLWPWTARPFGFRAPILHGYATAARTAHALIAQRLRGDACRPAADAHRLPRPAAPPLHRRPADRRRRPRRTASASPRAGDDGVRRGHVRRRRADPLTRSSPSTSAASRPPGDPPSASPARRTPAAQPRAVQEQQQHVPVAVERGPPAEAGHVVRDAGGCAAPHACVTRRSREHSSSARTP